MELSFGRAEAEEIYSTLVRFRVPPPFLDFEEAWTRFGETGPLLEFVYLVMQGDLLRERLADQIGALKRDANRGQRGTAELDLLRLVAAASAFGGRLNVKALAKYLQLPALDEAINLLENEHLMRRSEGGSLVEGLHPIRSEILVELLTDTELVPWADVAAPVLRLIDERDLESFLLHAFSRRRPDTDSLVDALTTFQPISWIGVAGAIRALIWLGLREYADANAELIGDARRDAGPGWSVVLDTDIANAMPGSAESLLDSLRELATSERLSQIQAFRARQTPKEVAFSRVASWIRARTEPPARPFNVEEWLAAATAAFWIGQVDADWPLPDWLPMEVTADATNMLPLDAVADLVVGLSEGYEERFPTWLEGIRATLRERFQRELTSPLLEDDGTRVTAHFLVSPDVSLETSSSTGAITYDPRNPLHNEALIRVNALRRFFPDREAYGCQGYGHGATLLQLAIDDTRKVDIPRSKLPLQWQTFVNATFGGIVSYALRPEDWAGYAREVIVLREEVVRRLNDLQKAHPGYLRSLRPQAIKVPSDAWYRTWILLREPPLLPQCAVDEWGFVYESLTDAQDGQERLEGRRTLSQIPTVRRYRTIVEAVRRYARSLENFLLQAPMVISANQKVSKQPAGSKRGNDSSPESRRWEEVQERRISTQNLADAWLALTEMQQRYRWYFAAYIDRRRIDTLDRRETELFEQVWPLWFAFALQPDRVLGQPSRDAPQLLDRTLQRLQKALGQEMGKCAGACVAISIAPRSLYCEGEPVLWLTVDGEDGIAVYGAAGAVLGGVRRAISSIADNELRRYTLDFYWKKVVVAPLIRGQSLNRMAWRVNTSLLTRAESIEDLSWLQLLMQPIPQETLDQLRIRVWDVQSLVLGTRLVEATNRLWPLVVHIAELSGLPELEGVGEDLTTRHLEKLMTEVNDALQTAIDEAAAMVSAVNDAIDRHQEPLGSLVVLALEALKELHQTLLPTEDFDYSATLSVSQFGAWAARLREGLRYAHIAQLAWASAVLQAKG